MSILGASVSGMNADTNWLSTISQNVANANTTGYKNVETEFSTLVDQSASTTENVTGVTTSVRALNALQGSVVGTSTATDLAIQGNGYFVVSDSAGSIYLTRNGSFVPDSSGNLVNASGYYLMGYNVQAGPADPAANSLVGLQKVNVVTAGQAADATTSGAFTANLPAAATAVAAANLPSTNSAGAVYTDKTSMVAYDNLGGAHTLDVYLTKTGANAWEATAYDSADAAPGGGFPYSAGPLTTQTLTFSPANGALTSGSPLVIPVPGGQTMSLDLSQTTQLAAAYSVTAATANGNAPASATGVSIGKDGTLSFTFSDGATRAGYDIPLANVASPDNMTAVNGDAFIATYNSGPVVVGVAGTGSFGSVFSSSLENSTVDIATELTNMIQAQSAYQANSKVFQTGADILQILDSLKA